MRLFLLLGLIFVALAYGFQAHSEEEEDSSESNQTEVKKENSMEIDANQSKYDQLETGLQTMDKTPGNQSTTKEKGTKNKDKNNRDDRLKKELEEIQNKQRIWFQNTDEVIKELKNVLENQNSTNQLNTAVEEIRDNQIVLKKMLEKQDSSNTQEITKVIENQNRLLQNFANGRRNLTVLGKPMEVLMEPNGWIVIQSRFDGSVNFYRKWKDYRNGFGSLDGEFWLGLDNIHALTSTKNYELLIQLQDIYGMIKFAQYKKFAIDGESEGYKLKTLDAYSGTAGDSLTGHRGKKFSTYDQDNDEHKESNCAAAYYGAWWYHKCVDSNLNGKYESRYGAMFMVWQTFGNDWRSMIATKMMIREV